MVKSKKLYTGKIPFDVFGNQLHYEGDCHDIYFEENQLDRAAQTVTLLKNCWEENEPSEIIDLRKIPKYNDNEDNEEFDYACGLDLFDMPRKVRHWGEVDQIGVIHQPIWKDNFVFEDTLTFKSYSRGRSAAYFHFERESGGEVTVFMTDMVGMISQMVKGKVSGKFTFCKIGGNFGCKLVE